MDDYKHALNSGAAGGSGESEVTRQQLITWLAAADQFAATGDANFADDGETAAAPVLTVGKPLKPAAVLILLVNHGDAGDSTSRESESGPRVLFTQRTAHLTDHAGQISFPGGRVEADDRDPIHTALRETEEETGLDAARIEVLGSIPHYSTGTGYQIKPVVAWIDGPVTYTPDPKEVAECFEVPFSFLIDERNHRLESAMYKGRMRSYYAVPYHHRYIWGATAGMLVTLTRVIAHARRA